jgi:hypothetical protein
VSCVFAPKAFLSPCLGWTVEPIGMFIIIVEVALGYKFGTTEQEKQQRFGS